MKENETIDEVDENSLEKNKEEEKKKFLTFFLSKEEYGIDIFNVKQIIGMQSITEVPDKPKYVLGIINLRGSVIPVIDVRLRFNMERKDYDDRTCIIVVNIENKTVGLVVDTVSEVIDIPISQIADAPKINNGKASEFIQGIGKVGDKVVIIINVSTLIFDKEVEEIGIK